MNKLKYIFSPNRIIDKIQRELYKITIPHKVKKLQNKEKITVLFILNDLSKWKSEYLYLAMKNHPRFTPILGITYRNSESISSYSAKVIELIDYFNKKKYPYIELNSTLKPNPDIIIYTEPYKSVVPKNQSAFAYWDSLFINITYSSHTTHIAIDYYARMQLIAWIDCYESRLALEDAYKYIGKKRKSLKLTGLPMFDIIKSPINTDPWKIKDSTKKRIVWAPHHSLGGFPGETIVYGNFLKICDYMFDLARKFNNEIQIAFKPHPLLKEKLEKIWGIQKTNDYYQKWFNLPNGQLETGDYVDLFKTSDALIHDSSSFIVEYQVLNKPTLFIVRNEELIYKDLNRFGEKFFRTQSLAYEKKDIEIFILDIINNRDLKRYEREIVLKEDMCGLNGMSASQNIIDLILSNGQ